MQTIIQTPTPNLQKSLDFYKRLNFTILSDENPTLVSDGKVIIEINPDRKARAALKLYNSDWSEIIDGLKEYSKVVTVENGYLLSDASGLWIYLLNGEIPEYDLSNVSPSTLGNSMGMSLEVIDVERSLAIYSILGFKITMGGTEQGWMVIAHSSGAAVSLMLPNACPHLFHNPSLTYFNGKNNLNIIEKIRQSGVEITEEITVFNKKNIVDNIILRDAGGLGFFVFSD